MVRAAHLDDSQLLEEQAKKAAQTGKSSFKAAKTGFEGREAEVGKAVQLALKTMANSAGYQHEMNDALVKARLQAMQFAKDNGMMEQYVEHDIKTMRPINRPGRSDYRQNGRQVKLPSLVCANALPVITSLSSKRRRNPANVAGNHRGAMY